MNINMKNKKFIMLDEEKSIEMKVKDTKLEQVKSLKYLREQIENNGKEGVKINGKKLTP